MKKEEAPQPTPEVSLQDKAIAWAELPAIKTEWLRKIAPELALDSKPLVIAEVIACIVGDDYSPIGHSTVSPENAALTKDMVLTRLRWEASVPELPTKLNSMIALAITHIERFDFHKPKQYKNAQSTWIVFKEEVEKLVDRDESLTAAVEYSRVHRHLLNKCWSEAVNGFPPQVGMISN